MSINQRILQKNEIKVNNQLFRTEIREQRYGFAMLTYMLNWIAAAANAFDAKDTVKRNKIVISDL
jgi:hypothetical protein